MTITATNSAVTQQLSAAIHVKSGTTTQKVDIQKYDIQINELNKSFLHNPQVRPSSFADLGKPNPNTGPNNALPDPNGPAPEGRGGKLDISA